MNKGLWLVAILAVACHRNQPPPDTAAEWHGKFMVEDALRGAGVPPEVLVILETDGEQITTLQTGDKWRVSQLAGKKSEQPNANVWEYEVPGPLYTDHGVFESAVIGISDTCPPMLQVRRGDCVMMLSAGRLSGPNGHRIQNVGPDGRKYNLHGVVVIPEAILNQTPTCKGGDHI